VPGGTCQQMRNHDFDRALWGAAIALDKHGLLVYDIPGPRRRRQR
jgi:hypothetical protein